MLNEHEWETAERHAPDKTYIKPKANWLLVAAAWLCFAAMPLAAVTPALLIFGTDFALAGADADHREQTARGHGYQGRDRFGNRTDGPFNTRSFDLRNSAFFRSLFGYSNDPRYSTSDRDSANFGNPFGQNNSGSYTGRGDTHERFGGPR